MAGTNRPRRGRSANETQPKYPRLLRFEVALRPEQRDQLAELARELQAARTSKEERITANTVVRVAVDYLLAHQEDLAGNTEDELRQSILPESGQQCRAARYVDKTQPRRIRLPRIEARLRPDQRDQLTELTREKMFARSSKEERFTYNTFARVAVDLLLSHRDKLVGNTEDEIRQSILPESGTSMVR